MQCVPNQDHRKLFIQQVTQENGALNPLSTGGTDKGYSYGIFQWNVHPMKAKTFLAKHPSEATLETQITNGSKGICDRYETYKGNIFQAIVAHTCPACAKANKDRAICLLNGEHVAWSRITPKECIAQGGRISLYFRDEINSKAGKARLTLTSL